MPRKAKATSELNDAPCKVLKSAPSDHERISTFLASTDEFPSESFGAEVRIMLQQGFDIGSTTAVEHQYVLQTEQMVEEVVRDAQNCARKALAECEGKIQNLDLEMQNLRESRQSLADRASSAHAAVLAEREAHDDKQAMVSRAEADKVVTARSFASSVKAQQLVVKEKSSVTAAIEGSLDVLLAGTAEADACKSHVQTVVQLMNDNGAEASLVASIPRALCVAPADRNQWHNITIDAMKGFLADVVAKLDARVAAATVHFTASEAEDMGAAAIVDHFSAQMLEAHVACDMAEQAADKADANLAELDERLTGRAAAADELKSEQTLLRSKADEVDAVLSILGFVRGRFQRLAAEEAENKARAEAVVAETPMTEVSPGEGIEVADSGDVAHHKGNLVNSSADGDVELPGDVAKPLHDGAVTSKLDVPPAALCRAPLGA